MAIETYTHHAGLFLYSSENHGFAYRGEYKIYKTNYGELRILKERNSIAITTSDWETVGFEGFKYDVLITGVLLDVAVVFGRMDVDGERVVDIYTREVTEHSSELECSTNFLFPPMTVEEVRCPPRNNTQTGRTSLNKNLFWGTQPVPKLGETVDGETNTFIEPYMEVHKVRAHPYTIPDAFVWSDVDLTDEKQLAELYNFFVENYVEDEDDTFRFDYSANFLKWALQMPGWLPQWHCGVRAKQSGRLVAFIAAVPQTIRVYDKAIKMVEINFLCVHKKFRSKRVAPVMIREITRRVNQQKIFQAAYTAGIVIPKPVGVCRYWHRSLNTKKLIEVKFSHLSAKMTLARTIKLYQVADTPTIRGLRPLEKKDVPSAFRLLSKHLEQFKLAPVFDEKEFEYVFIPRDDVVYSFVNVVDDEVTDLISFYSLPSSVMKHLAHKTIRAAYSFYNVAGTVTFKQLMSDALILAHNNNFDVFNALDLMNNGTVLEELKFGIGDGNLQYYLYNWKCPSMEPEQIGLVLQ